MSDETVYVDARRKYSVADVIDAVVSGDLAAIVDAARLYPALVISLQTNPVLLLRSLYGHKKARRAEILLKNVYYLERRTAVERFLNPPQPEDAIEGSTFRTSTTFTKEMLSHHDQETDEARALLERLKADVDD